MNDLKPQGNRWRGTITKKLLGSLGATCLVLAPIQTLGSPRAKEQIVDLSVLERDVWLGDSSKLYEIEQKVVREIQKNPKSAFAHYLLSYVFVNMLKQNLSELRYLEQASNMAQQAAELDPGQEYGYVALADALDITGNPEQGMQLLTQVEGLGVKVSWRHHFAMARLGVGIHPPKTTLEMFQKCLDANGSIHDVIIPHLLSFLQSAYPQDQLIQVYTQWNSKYPHKLFKQAYAMVLSEMGNHKSAQAILQTIPRSSDTDQEAIFTEAILQIYHLNQPKEAIVVLRKALDEGGTKLSASARSFIHSNLGFAYLNIGEDAQANTHYLLGLKDDVDYEKSIRLVFDSYQQAKKEHQFIKLLHKLNIERPGQAANYAMLGKLLSEKMSEHAAGIEAYKDALVLEPENVDFLIGIGLAYHRNDEFKKALQSFKAARVLDPQDSVAIYNEACMLAKLGQNEDALDALDQAIKLHPELQKIAVRDGDLASLFNHNRFIEITNTNRKGQDKILSH
jgi:tetratricopeptide (TPR) repeat protein